MPDQKKPNILVIWGDDIGTANLSCYTHGLMGYRTPNIDRLAKEGMMFTDAYGEQSCTAGRSSFITGQSVYRTGLSKVGLPGADVGLQAGDPTIAEVLKPLGYATGQFGKNHLGDMNKYLPTAHGFDEFFGNLYHLNAEEDPEDPDYPKDPKFKEKFGPRGVLHCWATDKDDSTEQPRVRRTGSAAAGATRVSVKHTSMGTIRRRRSTLLAIPVVLLLVAVGACQPLQAPGQAPPPAATGPSSQASPEQLASWNDGPSKKAIIGLRRAGDRQGWSRLRPRTRANRHVRQRRHALVRAAHLLSSSPSRSIACARSRPQHPEWKQKQPFKGILEGDMKAMAASGEKGLLEVIAVTHAGNTTEEFEKIVKDWVATARHPKTKRLYTEMVYQPMLELLTFLRANGFKTFIVSGGGVEFMRAWAEQVYGIPPEQVIGSRAKVKYELQGGKPVLLRLAEIDHIDDKAGKPVGIHQMIGRRPILAFGNSDGDFEMLEWTTSAPGPRFGAFVHHTDAVREWAYDRTSHIGQLARGLDEAPKRGWLVVDMKNDWKVIYPFEK